jgi:hypothetical protein
MAGREIIPRAAHAAPIGNLNWQRLASGMAVLIRAAIPASLEEITPV